MGTVTTQCGGQLGSLVNDKISSKSQENYPMNSMSQLSRLNLSLIRGAELMSAPAEGRGGLVSFPDLFI